LDIHNKAASSLMDKMKKDEPKLENKGEKK